MQKTLWIKKTFVMNCANKVTDLLIFRTHVLARFFVLFFDLQWVTTIKDHKINVRQRKIDNQKSVFQRVFPSKNALQSKSLDFYSPGEFTGKRPETHLHKRKLEILRCQEKRGIELNFTLKTKKPTRGPVVGESKKWSTILGISRTLLFTSKRWIFQIFQNGLFHYLEKFSARFIKNCTTLKWGTASPPDRISIVWTFTTLYVLIANSTICFRMILNTVWVLMGYKSLVQMFNNPVPPGRERENWFFACSEKYFGYSVL